MCLSVRVKYAKRRFSMQVEGVEEDDALCNLVALMLS